MDVPGLGFDGYARVPARVDGFWRVSHWSDPFDPPPPEPPLGTDPREDDGHRYDDPDGQFRTLYSATEPEGAIGECLRDFAYSASAARRIEQFVLRPYGGTADRLSKVGRHPPRARRAIG